MLRLLYKVDFKFDGTRVKNIRLKWLAICMNFNYENGTAEMFLNGKKVNQKTKKPIVIPEESKNKPLIIRYSMQFLFLEYNHLNFRFGRYYYDDTPLIGKVGDINVWDRYSEP